jgi:arginyl-tRNA synthetase
MDAWFERQFGCLYLQPIFIGTEVQQKLHQEAANWQTVNYQWPQTILLTHQSPNFANVMHRDHLLEI